MEAILNLIKISNVKEDAIILFIYDALNEPYVLDNLNVIAQHYVNVIAVYDDTILAHGVEPNDETITALQTAELCFCLTKFSIAHTKARIDFVTRGGRFLSMPGLDSDLLEHAALHLDFKAYASEVRSVANRLTKARSFKLVTDNATLEGSLEGRVANACPGYVDDEFSLGSPPDIEANISPIETSVSGSFTVNGSVTLPSIGLIDKPFKLTFLNGVIIEIEADCHTKRSLENHFSKEIHRRTIAELGIGFNPLSELNGSMLFDEGARGYVHLGVGDNSTVGGQNTSDRHIDFVSSVKLLLVDDELVIYDKEIQV